MSQHDLDIANASGSAVRSDLNLALKALGSTSKGSSAPGTLQTGQLWIDDSGTPWVLKVYDGAQHITIGTINATTNAFSLAVGQGGTGAATATAGFDALAPMTAEGDIMYGGTSGTVTRLAKGTDGQTLRLASGVPAWGAVAVAGGGTGATTATAGFDALAPMTAEGDLMYGGSSGTVTRLAKGSDTQVLTLASGVPTWAAASGGGFPSPDFTSSEQTVTLDTALNVAHSIGAVPNLWTVVLRCKTTDAGWSVGDELAFSHIGDSSSQGFTCNADATNVTVVTGHNLVPHNQSSKNMDTALTVGSWRWVIRAWE